MWNDLRYSARVLIRNRSFSLVAIITLALGIGANSAIFSVIDAVLLKPLPFDKPERVMQIWSTNTEEGRERNVVSVPDFLDWQEQSGSFERVAAYASTNFSLSGSGEPERIRGVRVSSNLLPVLHVSPILGRAFTAEDDRFGGGRVVLLSYRLWQRRFGGDTQILGQSILLNDEPYTVIGILPANLNYPVTRDAWVPLAFDPNQSLSKRSSAYLYVVGRLGANATRGSAQAEMDSIAHNLAEQYPATNRTRGIFLLPVYEQIVGNVRSTLLMLFGAVSLVLLIACINVANLLLARANARRREMAIRTALGAGRLRLMRQCLVESVLLGLFGGGLGLLLAYWGIKALLPLVPPLVPSINQIGVDSRVLAWTFLTSIITGLLFGLAPALDLSRADLTEALKEGSPHSSVGPGRASLRSLLVVGEVAISLVLLVCAGLMVKSLIRLYRVDAGFNVENLLTFSVSLPRTRYPDKEKQRAFHSRVLERLRNLPGIDSTGATTVLPLTGRMEASDFRVVGRQTSGDSASVNERAVSADYLSTMGISILRGRPLTATDDQNSSAVCLINEQMARRVFPNEDPLDHEIEVGGVRRQIIAIVSDVKHRTLDAEPDHEMYVAYGQHNFLSTMNYVLRTRLKPSAVIGTVREAVRSENADQVVENFGTMEEVVLKSMAQSRFYTFLLSLFAATALLIASIGLYGVLSYLVSQRTREIGVRIALGAQRRSVLALVLRQGLGLALVGILAGMAGALFATPLLSSLLFEVTPRDPTTFIGVPLLLACVAVVAIYLPAARAARVDPMVALRNE